MNIFENDELENLCQQLQNCQNNLTYHSELCTIQNELAAIHEQQITNLYELEDKLALTIQRFNELKCPSTLPRDVKHQIILESDDD